MGVYTGKDAKKSCAVTALWLASCISLASWVNASAQDAESNQSPKKDNIKAVFTNKLSATRTTLNTKPEKTEKKPGDVKQVVDTQPATSTTATSSSKDVLRLTKSVKPSAYELTFVPDLEKFTYTGKETITLELATATKDIVINALEMTISNAELEAVAGGKKLSGKVEIDAVNEQARIHFDEELKPGSYKLNLQFNSILNDQLRGFYRSYYKDSAGEKHWLCSSQMEPADARRMFPCFDEPEFKATFKLTAVIDPKLAAISNAPVEKTYSEDGKKVVVFEASPKMSTYLMCLVVGDFKSTEERKSCDVPIRVWAPAGQEKMGEYSLGAACEIMTFLSDYFGIKFPTKKLDLIAIPDFAPGAMENLGAITFKDSLLLIDEKTGSNFAKRSAFSVIAHEMAHQWFGDLVTSRWWDDLWLNEAFATWTATKTENTLRPAWRIRTKSVMDSAGAMGIDELQSTRAIRSHVGNPKQASEMFDTITYDKGSGVLRMLEVYVGEKVFQKGVHDYLEAHKFDNATGEDLWLSIGAAAKGLPVPKMMTTWIMQKGFPLVTAVDQEKGKSVSLSQEKFLVMPNAVADNAEWIVPVMVRDLKAIPSGSTDSGKALLLDKKQQTFALKSSENPPVINAGASGFYRVKYSDAALKTIQANFNLLTPDERIKLVSDVSTLAWKGTVPVESSLNFMHKLSAESDSIVQGVLAEKFKAPRYFVDDKSRPTFEKFVGKNLLPLKVKLGWEEKKGEEETLKDLRSTVIQELGTFGQDKQTVKEANELYAKYLKDRQALSPDMVSTVLNIVAYNGSDKEYSEMIEALKKAANPQEEKRFLTALGYFRQAEIIGKVLDLSIATDTRATDGVSILSALLNNHNSNVQAWKFTKTNWEKITKKFPPRFNKRIIAACNSFDTPEAESELKAFFDAHPLEMGKSAIGRMLEEVSVAVLYRQRNAEKIQQWVNSQQI